MIGINKCLNPGQQIVAQDFLSDVFIFMLFFSFYISLLSRLEIIGPEKARI